MFNWHSLDSVAAANIIVIYMLQNIHHSCMLHIDGIDIFDMYSSFINDKILYNI